MSYNMPNIWMVNGWLMDSIDVLYNLVGGDWNYGIL